jgi:TonB family protein
LKSASERPQTIIFSDFQQVKPLGEFTGKHYGNYPIPDFKSMKIAFYILAILALPAFCKGQDTAILKIDPVKGDTIIIENPIGKVVDSVRYIQVEQMPVAGYDVYKFIAEKMRYPKDAYDAGIGGRINVQFKVSEEGYLDSFKILKPLYPSLDSEALRVVKSLPQPWKPAKHMGKIVSIWYTLPVFFRQE